MSRSKGSRKTTKSAQNIEFWSRRPYSNNHGAIPGRISKTLTHRQERRDGERDLQRRKDDA